MLSFSLLLSFLLHKVENKLWNAQEGTQTKVTHLEVSYGNSNHSCNGEDCSGSTYNRIIGAVEAYSPL